MEREYSSPVIYQEVPVKPMNYFPLDFLREGFRWLNSFATDFGGHFPSIDLGLWAQPAMNFCCLRETATISIYFLFDFFDFVFFVFFGREGLGYWGASSVPCKWFTGKFI